MQDMLYNRVNHTDNKISTADNTRPYLSRELDGRVSTEIFDEQEQDQNDHMFADGDDQYLDPIISDQLSKDEVEFYTLIPALQLFLSKEIDFGIQEQDDDNNKAEEAQRALILCIAYLIFQELSTSDAFDMPQYTTYEQKQIVIQRRHQVVSEAIQKYCDQMVADHVQFWENYESVFEAYEQISYFLMQELQR